MVEVLLKDCWTIY